MQNTPINQSVSQSVLYIIRPKCTLAASHAAPWWVTASMRTAQMTDRRTDARPLLTLCFPLDSAKRNNRRTVKHVSKRNKQKHYHNDGKYAKKNSIIYELLHQMTQHYMIQKIRCFTPPWFIKQKCECIVFFHKDQQTLANQDEIFSRWHDADTRYGVVDHLIALSSSSSIAVSTNCYCMCDVHNSIRSRARVEWSIYPPVPPCMVPPIHFTSTRKRSITARKKEIHRLRSVF